MNSSAGKNTSRKINNIHKQTTIKGSSVNNYWTFREDEILSKSVQRYGTNKWNKIATLLVKKSAIQCKLRWEEYLLPKLQGNKQVKFDSDDDKELLRLCNLYRDQWKTIADIMGKTAASCLKRYNELITIDDDADLDAMEAGEKDENKLLEMTISESLQPKLFSSTETHPQIVSDEISHDAEQRLVSNLDKKKIKKDRATREFNEMVNSSIQKRRDMLKIGIKNYQLRLPNQISKFKRLDGLVNDENLMEPPRGEFDTSAEIKANRALLADFESLIAKKNVYHANKDLHFEYLYRRRDLVRDSSKEKHVMQIGRNRNFKPKKRETRSTELLSDRSLLQKVNFVKPKIPGSIVGDSGDADRVTWRRSVVTCCADHATVERAKAFLARLPPPLNDFEIGDEDGAESEDALEPSVKEESESEIEDAFVKEESEIEEELHVQE